VTLTDGKAEEIGAVKDEGDMFPFELAEDAGEDEAQPTLAVGHPR
jgi:hypothetical protein